MIGSLRFKIFFWIWFASIPVWCFWWADLVLRGFDGSRNPLVNLFVLGLVLGGWWAYLAGSFSLMNWFDEVRKGRR